MRVLFLVSQAEWTGASRVFVQAARGLAARGIEVGLVCPGGSDVAAHAGDDAVAVIGLPPRAGLLRTIWTLRRALRGPQVGVVFVHTADEQRAAERARRLGSRATVVRRESAFEELGVDLSAIDAVAPASRASLNAASAGPLVGCWCGRDARIAIIRALRALARLAARHGDFHALMAGPGARDDTLRVHAAALGLHGALTWIPDRAPALSAMHAADIGWVAADGEDAGFAVLECMAARVPVVAHDEARMRRFLGTGEAGLLLDTADAPRSAAELTLLLANPERRRLLGDAGRARVEQSFTERVMVDVFGRRLPEDVATPPWAAP